MIAFPAYNCEQMLVYDTVCKYMVKVLTTNILKLIHYIEIETIGTLVKPIAFNRQLPIHKDR